MWPARRFTRARCGAKANAPRCPPTDPTCPFPNETGKLMAPYMPDPVESISAPAGHQDATPPGSRTALLATGHLVKQYRKRRVVNGVSIQVNAGEIVGLLGPNGAGKT